RNRAVPHGPVGGRGRRGPDRGKNAQVIYWKFRGRPMTGHSRQNTLAVAQRGQAMVLGMLLAGLALIAFVRYFSTGQVAAATAKQLHALDAAAYSGELIQARALNMMAYINRAHVGHQLALAHLVTLGSWAALGATQARQLGSGNPPAHLIAMLFGPDHGA